MTLGEAYKKIKDRHCTNNHYCTDNCMQGEDCCEYAIALGAIEILIDIEAIKSVTENAKEQEK